MTDPAPFVPVLNSRSAALSLFFAMLCTTFYGYTGVPALGLGVYALVQMRMEPGRWKGAGSAWFGTVMGAAFTLLHPLGMAMYATLYDKLLDLVEFRDILSGR